jgi:hypothetical protein
LSARSSAAASATPELAHTGAELSDAAYVALFVLFVGGIVTWVAWVLRSHDNERRH